MDTIFLISKITKDDFLAHGFAINEVNGVLIYNSHSAQAVWERGEDGEYLYAIAFESDVIKAIYETFDPILLDADGFQKWCCAVTDEDSESIAVAENLRVKDAAYGDEVKYETTEEE